MNRKKHPRTSLTPAMRDALIKEKERTALGAIALLTHFDPAPKGLGPSAIENWISGKAQSARTDHYELVLSKWRDLPDNAPQKRRPLKTTTGRIEITPEMRKQLECIHKSAPSQYLRRAPDGFTSTKMAHILNGRDRTMPESAWRYVLAFAEKARIF